MHDLVVVSDLHLGRGRNPETGRYHALEAFFYDEDFAGFCRYLCSDAAARGVPLRLVLNGDVFDLLRIEPDDVPANAGPFERYYGPALTAAAAARMVAHVLSGHPAFVDGLTGLLAAGHEIVFLPGNHDAELQWAPVQAEIRRSIAARLAERAPGGDSTAALERLRFEPWFYHEPGRIWIEHGSQYDAESSFRYPLRAGLETAPAAVVQAEQDLPLASFFQRYLYNAFGPITFLVPSARASSHYVLYLLMHRPRLLLRVLASHLPFLLQVLRRVSQQARVSTRDELRRLHEAELAHLAEASSLGDKLGAVDQLKENHADLYLTVREVVRSFGKLAAVAVLVALLGLGLWSVAAAAINQLKTGIGLKTLLLFALNLLFLTGAISSIGYAILHGRPEVSTGPVRGAASRIARLLDVPLVVFGHTHDEIVWRIDRQSDASTAGPPAWYFNTGTWIAVFSSDLLVPRERVQFTFLRVRGTTGELLHWSPGRGQPVPVILLEEQPDDPTVTARPASARPA